VAFNTLNNKFGSSADELAKAGVLHLGWSSSQRLSYRAMLQLAVDHPGVSSMSTSIGLDQRIHA
jgi:hypothetical protein